MKFAMTMIGETDPLIVAVVSVSLTLVVGISVGLVTASLTRRGEHAKWVREQRYVAYVAFMVDMSAMTALIEATPTIWNISKLLRRYEVQTEKSRAAFEAVSLLGPRDVNAAGQRWLWAATTFAKSKTKEDRTALSAARWDFLVSAGGILGSRNVTAEPMPASDGAQISPAGPGQRLFT
jgi:hypothetical protein